MQAGAGRAGGENVDLRTIADALRASRDVLVVTHRNPDGDAVGSAAALAAALRALGIKVTVVCPDPVPGYLLRLPGATEFIHTVERDDFDLVVSVDVSDPALLQPLPIAEARFFQERRSINIDHHFSNLFYGALNHVDAEAASATEIVGRLLRDELGFPYSADVASDLLYGVVNDTHSFQNSNTTPATLRFSADLVEAGADLSAIVFNLLLEKRVSAARLWAASLPTLRFAEEDRVAMLTVTLDALANAGGTMEDADGLVEFLRNIQGVELAVLFKQTGVDEYRLSLRTSASVDATVVAGIFGGGGHQRASGGDAKGDLDEVERRIVEVYRATRVAEAG